MRAAVGAARVRGGSGALRDTLTHLVRVRARVRTKPGARVVRAMADHLGRLGEM